MRRRRFLAGLFAASALPAHAQVPEAITTVSDAAALRRALSAAKPGSVILLADGPWRDLDLVIEAEGTPDAPIQVRAATQGKVLLEGRSRLRLGGRHVNVSGLRFEGSEDPGEIITFRSSTTRLAEHCRVSHCAIVHAAPADPEANTKWVSLYGAANRFDHCYLEGKKNLGTTLVVWLREGDPPNEHQIDHNYFGFRPSLGQNGGETIRVGDSNTSMLASRTRVFSNYFHRCNGEVEIISNKSCFNHYYNNTFEECEGALTLRHGNDCRVEANWFLGNSKPNTGGVRIIGERHEVINNYFANLTGRDTRAACSFMNGLSDSPLNGYFQVRYGVVAFNTFVNCAEPFVVGIHTRADAVLPPTGVIVASNVVTPAATPTIRLADERSELRLLANFFDQDPGLTDQDGIWRPTRDSPVIGAGTREVDAANDIDGQPRTLPRDAGCDQLSGEPTTWPRVGPGVLDELL